MSLGRVLAALFLLVSGMVQADEYRPAFLEIRETSAENFDVLWKVPAQGDMRLSLYVRFPAEVQVTRPPRAEIINGAFIERYSIRRDGGMAGAEIVIEGLSSSGTDVLVRIEGLDGSSLVERLAAANPSMVIGAAPTRFEVARTYTLFGIEHILEGIDHLLFVACLVLIARTPRRILITITGFTIAHSITLSLAALELVRLPIPPIEAVIALSIVFLAREIALNRKDTLTWRYPIAVSGSFGLLHGFGFASALGEIGLPQTEIPAALLAFNVGVEIGQIVFVCAIISLTLFVTYSAGYLARLSPNSHWNQLSLAQPMELVARLEKPVAFAVGSITIVWTIERFSVFWI
ncbi:MAG: HupE/UreJ family protein [Pseudomonadales bacterium]|nr:HupE/UreJ family protein [Pseudomonadales bacterium]